MTRHLIEEIICTHFCLTWPTTGTDMNYHRLKCEIQLVAWLLSYQAKKQDSLTFIWSPSYDVFESMTCIVDECVLGLSCAVLSLIPAGLLYILLDLVVI